MKIATIVVRTLLGLVFFVFGLNYFLKFMPNDPKLNDTAMSFVLVLATSGYMTAVKIFEIVGGLLLLTGQRVPLGITLVTPVIVNITFFDLFLVGSPAGMGIPLLLMAGFLIYAYWPAFKPILSPATSR